LSACPEIWRAIDETSTVTFVDVDLVVIVIVDVGVSRVGDHSIFVSIETTPSNNWMPRSTGRAHQLPRLENIQRRRDPRTRSTPPSPSRSTTRSTSGCLVEGSLNIRGRRYVT